MASTQPSTLGLLDSFHGTEARLGCMVYMAVRNKHYSAKYTTSKNKRNKIEYAQQIAARNKIRGGRRWMSKDYAQSSSS